MSRHAIFILIAFLFVTYTNNIFAKFNIPIPMPSSTPAPPPPPKCHKNTLYMAAGFIPPGFSYSLVSPTQNEFSDGSSTPFRLNLSVNNIGQQESVMVPKGPVGYAQVLGGTGSIEGSAKCVQGTWRPLTNTSFAMKHYAVNMVSNIPGQGVTAGSLIHAYNSVWTAATNPTQNTTFKFETSANYSGTVYGMSRDLGGISTYETVHNFTGRLLQHSAAIANKNSGTYFFTDYSATINNDNPWDINYALSVSDIFPGGTWSLPNPGNPSSTPPIPPTIGGLTAIGSFADVRSIGIHYNSGNSCVTSTSTIPTGSTLDEFMDFALDDVAKISDASYAAGVNLSFGILNLPTTNYPFIDSVAPGTWGMCPN